MIGVVVAAADRARFAAAAGTLTGVDVAWAVYRRDSEIRELVAGVLREERLAGLLLGLLPHAKCRGLLPQPLPIAVTRPAALDLAVAWARARGNATPVSIDTFDRETVDEVAHALHLDPAAIETLPFDPDQPVDEIVAFHRTRPGRLVITGRSAVLAALDGTARVLHAPAQTATIRAALHELTLRIRGAQRFAAAVFRPGTSGDDRLRVGLQHLLLHTPEFADAWIDRHGDRGLLALAPAALFETATRRWVALPVLDAARETLGAPVVAGFGIGRSARHSVALAEQAATRAEQDPAPAAYLFTDDGVTIGPMGAAATPLAFRHRSPKALDALAGRAGLSAATLSRLAAVEQDLAGRPVSPGEPARVLGITDPSGRRLIRKLSDAALAVGDGSAQVHRRGRPSRLYRLAIASALEAS